MFHSQDNKGYVVLTVPRRPTVVLGLITYVILLVASLIYLTPSSRTVRQIPTVPARTISAQDHEANQGRLAVTPAKREHLLQSALQPIRKQKGTESTSATPRHVRPEGTGTSPGKTAHACLRLLLIIIFNKGGNYKSVDFLRNLYGRAFRHIVVYGPGKNLPDGVRPSLDDSGGFYQQRTVIKAMREYPDYDGYFWIPDDIWLNFPRLLLTMDPNKIWMNGDNETNWVDARKSIDNFWKSWIHSFGLPAVRRHYHQIPKKFTGRSASVFGEPGMVVRSYSDVIYVPRRFVADFISVADQLPDVMFEIAVPTALYLMSKKEDRQSFPNAMILWYDGKRAHMWDFWSTNVSFLHPVKMSNRASREYVVKWTDESIKALNFKIPDHYNC